LRYDEERLNQNNTKYDEVVELDVPEAMQAIEKLKADLMKHQSYLVNKKTIN